MERAHEILQTSQPRIIVRVAPGEYVENVPLYVNISNIELRGRYTLTPSRTGLPLVEAPVGTLVVQMLTDQRIRGRSVLGLVQFEFVHGQFEVLHSLI